MSIKTYVPWPLKIAAKTVLSRLPISSDFWKKARLFEHGSMEDPDYAYSVFKVHFDRANGFTPLKKGFTCLEMGPGESLYTALIAKAFGGEASILIDSGDYALRDTRQYEAMGSYLYEKKNLKIPADGFRTFNEYLAECSGQYLTDGLSSLKSLPNESVDFSFSHAVLEHIKRTEFLDTMRELRRVMRSDGVSSHRIDLKDHLNNSLNNLRFSDRIWESDWMRKSGFYTNRIQHSEMMDLFRSANFEPQVVEENRWPKLPLSRSKLSKPFRDMSDDELCISGFSVVLKPV